MLPLDNRFPVAIAVGTHPFPFRTRQLRPPAPMVLRGRPLGRVGRRRDLSSTTTHRDLWVVVVFAPSCASPTLSACQLLTTLLSRAPKQMVPKLVPPADLPRSDAHPDRLEPPLAKGNRRVQTLLSTRRRRLPTAPGSLTTARHRGQVKLGRDPHLRAGPRALSAALVHHGRHVNPAWVASAPRSRMKSVPPVQCAS